MEFWDGSGIHKLFALCFRHVTMLAPYQLFYYKVDALPDAQTVSKHFRHECQAEKNYNFDSSYNSTLSVHSVICSLMSDISFTTVCLYFYILYLCEINAILHLFCEHFCNILPLF